MWRAQGYIQKETPDENAHNYIEELLRLSFIQKAANLDDHYVVHDLLHDFAEFISNGEHFRIEDDFHVSIPENVRHLYVNASKILKVFISLTESEVKKGLRSLIICRHDAAYGDGIPTSNFNKALEETLNLPALRSLRVLVLRHQDGILPDNIEHLVHLRLRFLHALEEYHVMTDSRHRICQLKELNELRGKLTIKNLEKVRGMEESSKARLIKKQSLKKISFCWNHLPGVM
ncbi:hypothetical protein EJB05_47380, partial [Eragrostis curvula]